MRESAYLLVHSLKASSGQCWARARGSKWEHNTGLRQGKPPMLPPRICICKKVQRSQNMDSDPSTLIWDMGVSVLIKHWIEWQGKEKYLLWSHGCGEHECSVWCRCLPDLQSLSVHILLLDATSTFFFLWLFRQALWKAQVYVMSPAWGWCICNCQNWPSPALEQVEKHCFLQHPLQFPDLL